MHNQQQFRPLYQLTATYAQPESPVAFIEHYRTKHVVRELPKLTFLRVDHLRDR